MAQKRSRLVTKLLVVVLAIIVVMTLVQSFVIIQSVRKTTGTSYEEECKALTNVYVDLLSSKIQEYKNLLQVYTNADIVKTGDPKAIVDWLQSHAEIRSNEFDYVAFVDLEGNFDSDIMTHTSVPDRSYYIDIIKNGMDETMDNPVASKVSGKFVVHICKAAKVNGRTIGFFTGIVTLEKLENIIKGIKIGKSGYATLMSGEHSVIATSDDSTAKQETADAVNESIAGGTMVEAVMKAVATGEIGGVWDRTSEGKRCYLTFKTIAGTPSWLFMFSIEEDQVYAASNTVVKLMVIVASVYIIVMLFVIGLLVTASLKPLEIVRNTIGGIAHGDADLTQRIVLRHANKNEIGDVVDGFNQFSDKLQQIIKSLKDSKIELVNAGRALNESTEETESSITQIISTIEAMAGNIGNQSQSVSQTAGAVNEIASNIESLNHMIAAQATSVTQASAAVEEMIGNINSVDASVSKMAGAFEDLEKKAITGVQKQDDVNQLIKTVEAESQTLQEANAVISSIAEQTNLLAMNAAIEAAHAGEAGKGFSVVADEIRKLSETSSQQSKTIGEQLQKISSTIQGIVQASLQAGKAFEDVSFGINGTNSLVQEIKNAMIEQGEGSKQISLALNNMNDSTSEVRTASMEMSEGNKAILQEIKLLQDTTINMKQGMEEMGVGAKKINETGASLSVLSEKVESSILKIGQQIDQFKV